MAAATATQAVPDTTEELSELAAKWLREVGAHRRAAGAFGRVGSTVVKTPEGTELHLSEETTFKLGKVGECPLDAALKWLAARRRDRKRYGATGTGKVEFEQKKGVFTSAKIIEVTVVKIGEPLDVPPGQR